MSRALRSATIASALLVATLLLSTTAAAGQAAQSSQGQGPLVLQKIENPFVIAPDVKITSIANTTGVLVGGYAGVNLDQTFLIGGAGYWVVDPLDTVHMGYGGLLVGWRVVKSGAISFAVRDLIGFGSATTYQTYAVGVPYPTPNYGRHYQPYPYGRYGYWTDFFVTEPEVRAQFALGPAVSIDAGVGYRVTSAGYGLNNQLNGVTGSIAVRFNIGQ